MFVRLASVTMTRILGPDPRNVHQSLQRGRCVPSSRTKPPAAPRHSPRELSIAGAAAAMHCIFSCIHTLHIPGARTADVKQELCCLCGGWRAVDTYRIKTARRWPVYLGNWKPFRPGWHFMLIMIKRNGSCDNSPPFSVLPSLFASTFKALNNSQT